jgi:molybdenum cofactor cytidylyltransferase
VSALQPIGLLLAAGKGTRMGQTKQLIELPNQVGQLQPLVAVAFDAIATTCDPMIVVIGAEKERVVASLGERSFVAVEVSGTQQMSDSARAGLETAKSMGPDRAVLLQLADHPEVGQATLKRLCDESALFPKRTIIPTFRGTGGHPILIPPEVVTRLLSETTVGPLNAYWRKHPDLCVRCEVMDSAVIRDLDHPAQLADEVRRRGLSRGR